jgi:hypothetical protein
MHEKEDWPIMIQALGSAASLQPVAETEFSRHGHFSRNKITPTPKTGESLFGSGGFFQEQWEEWMAWDGVAESLSPKPDPRRSLETKEPNDIFHPPRSPPNPGTEVATLVALNQAQPVTKKRKKTSEGAATSEADGGKAKPPPGQERSHTIIEKRYRTNLNDKIAALRDSVPSLRVDEVNSVDIGASTPAAKLHKATILSKATEYIQQLEKRNRALEKENAHLRCRYRSSRLESNDRTEPRDGDLPSYKERASFPSLSATPPCPTDSARRESSPEGLIPVPENMKRLRLQVPQEHYAGHLRSTTEQDGTLSQEVHASGQPATNHGKLVGKLMLGSLAGLFIMEGFTVSEGDGRDPDGRGLWALPLPHYSAAFHSQWASRWSIPGSTFLSMTSVLRAVAIFFILALAVFLYLFSAKPTPSRKSAVVTLAAAPSLASPIEARQQAWLTSIQTVWVPRHRMLPELIALHLEASKYLLRKVIGWSGYAWLTGKTEDDETARIKAWDIAIDAQLTGGDSEVSKSRLVLTILASGTLPNTPARLMLKALHIWVLLWEASKSGWSVWYFLHKAASQLARRQWLLAQKVSKMQQLRRPNSSCVGEDLPNHLAELLKLDSDELFTDRIVQRAYNMTWDRPTHEDVDDEDLGVDMVVEDCAIRSPLDALAAWASSYTLRQTIHAWYNENCWLSESHKSQIQLALDIAPPTSSAYVRALAAKTVFVETDRGLNITKLLREITPSKLGHTDDGMKPQHKSTFIDSSIPEPIRNDVNAIRQCASAIDSLTGQTCTHREIYKAVDTLATIYVNADALSLLGLAASHQLLRVLADQAINQETASRLDYIRTLLKTWINDPERRKIPLDAQERAMITTALDRVVMCPSWKRRHSGASNDTGYESMSDAEEIL